MTTLGKPQRQHRIGRLLEEQAVSSQGQLVELLASEGILATQATVSRDLEDLGAVNAVLADAVQRRMLGQQVDLDREVASEPRKRPRGKVSADADIAGQVRRLHDQLEASVAALNLTPTAMKRVVDTALDLSHQQALTPGVDPDPVWDVPALTGTWEVTTRDLPHPLRPEQRRPVTFDPTIAAKRREDVVFAHLGHPLVARATRLLRAAVTSTDVDLHRVTAVLSDDTTLEDVLAVSYARFVVVGADGVRLHEEVLHAGGWVRPNGRFARLESFARLDAQLTVALGEARTVPQQWLNRLTAGWGNTENGLFRSLERRAAERPEGVLQSFRQRDEAFTAEHHMGMFEAGIDEAEVIEPVIKDHAAYGDVEVAHVGKVGQAHAPGFMRLAEDHLAFGAMQSAPRANAPLQRAADSIPEFWMAPDHLLEDRDWPQARRRRQHRHDFLLENGAERIGAPPFAPFDLCRWQAWVLFDAIGRGCAERRLGRRDGNRLGLTEFHKEPHLVVG